MRIKVNFNLDKCGLNQNKFRPCNPLRIPPPPSFQALRRFHLHVKFFSITYRHRWTDLCFFFILRLEFFKQGIHSPLDVIDVVAVDDLSKSELEFIFVEL